MRIGASFLALALFFTPAALAQEDIQHKGTFEEALEHHSGADLRGWRDAHPWSLGDRLSGFFEDLLATRRVGERLAKEHADLQAAFLAESLAQDPFSGWVMQVRAWDTEACARHETALATVSALPEMIAAGEADAAWTGIADLRDHVVPPGGWPLCAPDLVRAAGAFLHAGDLGRARSLATEIATAAEELRQGAVLAACERILGEIAREEGDLAASEQRISRSFELRKGLDSGSLTALPDEIERLDRCDIDTLIEFTVGEKECLAVVVGTKGASARRLPIGRAEIEENVRRILDAAAFDEKASRELGGRLLPPIEAQLGARIGIVPDGDLGRLPFEILVSEDTRASLGRDHSIVYLSRPPLGGAKPVAATVKPAGAFVIVGGAGSSPKSAVRSRLEDRFAPVRTIDPKSPADLARGSAGARAIHFEQRLPFNPESLKTVHLDAALVVLASADPGAATAASAEAFHAAGVRDVVASLRPVDPEKPDFLLHFYGHLPGGESAPEAARSARRELIEGNPTVDPRTWAAWIVHRRY